MPVDIDGLIARVAALHAGWDEAPPERLGRDRFPLLGRNLEALGRRRPDVLGELARAHPTGRFALERVKDGRPSISRMSESGNRALVNGVASFDSLHMLRVSLSALAKPCERAESVGILGVGDGYLLQALARLPQAGFLGRTQAVFVVEPDLEILLHSLMIHDLTGPDGPIEQERFLWLVGPSWGENLRRAVREDPYLPAPLVAGSGDERSEALHAPYLQACREGLAEDPQSWSRTESHYAALAREEIVDLFLNARPRPPRVLLLTTRFSTVLQYATRDTARGFEENGWQARILIEPTPHHRMLRRALRLAIAEWRPDLVFQIDHLRYEHGDCVPRGLPFACWTQDPMANIMCREAGARTSRRDFVLTPWLPALVGEHGFLRRQCVDMPLMLAAPRDGREAAHQSEGCCGEAAADLVYVSNASADPREVARQLLARLSGSPADLRLAGAFCERLHALYEAGRSLASCFEVDALLASVGIELGVRIAEPGAPASPAAWSREVYALLHRQQGLRWVAREAERRGATLAIFGHGWEKNREFARYARGPVAPGPDADLTMRQAKIVLQLEPWACFQHQRLLDCLAAGGFLLIRDHPANVLLQEMTNFLEAHLESGIESVETARRALRPEFAAKLEALLGRAAHADVKGDPIALVQSWRRAGLLIPQAQALPRLDEVTFSNPETLRRLVDRFLDAPDLRAEISDAQRRNIIPRLSYTSIIRRVVRSMSEIIAAEPPEPEIGGGADSRPAGEQSTRRDRHI